MRDEEKGKPEIASYSDASWPPGMSSPSKSTCLLDREEKTLPPHGEILSLEGQNSASGVLLNLQETNWSLTARIFLCKSFKLWVPVGQWRMRR